LETYPPDLLLVPRQEREVLEGLRPSKETIFPQSLHVETVKDGESKRGAASLI